MVLTGFPDTDMAVSYMREGVIDYLVKPVDGAQLRAPCRAQWNDAQWPGGDGTHATFRQASSPSLFTE